MIFSREEALPAELSVHAIATACAELGAGRLAEAAALVGEGKARELADRLGAYELDDKLARQLELEGLVLGRGGEFPALSPKAWAALPATEAFPVFRARLAAAGGDLRGLLLDSAERRALEGFLSRSKVAAPDPWRLVEIARHFFFGESLKVVVRYTAPRLNQP